MSFKPYITKSYITTPAKNKPETYIIPFGDRANTFGKFPTIISSAHHVKFCRLKLDH